MRILTLQIYVLIHYKSLAQSYFSQQFCVFTLPILSKNKQSTKNQRIKEFTIKHIDPGLQTVITNTLRPDLDVSHCHIFSDFPLRHQRPEHYQNQ